MIPSGSTISTDPNAGCWGMPAVEARGLVKVLGGRRVLDAVDLEIRSGEFFTLLGPSGCGKTTLLRLIAGLENADGGDLLILGRNSANWPAHDRPVNTVFQSYALFPHLTVLENIRFGPRMKKLPDAETRARVESVVELTRIGELVGRMPHELSGGQRQRVALARALVNQPRILLLDEPLAALDLKLRQVLQEELRPLQRRLGTTFVYVTHDQDEAMILSDRLAVMNQGRLLQVGTPHEIYDHPRDPFTAHFLGGCNVLEALCQDGAWRTPAGPISLEVMNDLLRGSIGASERVSGGRLSIGFRPERVLLIPSGMRLGGEPGRSSEVLWEGKLVEARLSGASWRCVVQAGATQIRAVLIHSGRFSHREGDAVRMAIPAEALRLLE